MNLQDAKATQVFVNGQSIIDVTGTTASKEAVYSGRTFLSADGTATVGTLKLPLQIVSNNGIIDFNNRTPDDGKTYTAIYQRYKTDCNIDSLSLADFNRAPVVGEFFYAIIRTNDGTLVPELYLYAICKITAVVPGVSNAWAYKIYCLLNDINEIGMDKGAYGNYSTSKGWYSKAVGHGASAEGGNTLALEDYTHVEGRGPRYQIKITKTEENDKFLYVTDSESVPSKLGYDNSDRQPRVGEIVEYELITPNGEYDHIVSFIYGIITQVTEEGVNKYIYLDTLDDAVMSTTINTFIGATTFKEAIADGVSPIVTCYRHYAMGYASHAEGARNHVAGGAAHGEGVDTTAAGRASHSEGSSTSALAEGSHSEGMSTIAAGRGQHVQGEYNIRDEAVSATRRATYAHIVGNGTANNARSNAHTLDWNGNAWFAGDVYVGSTSGINKDEGSKKLATEQAVNTALNTAKEYTDTVKATILGEDDKLVATYDTLSEINQWIETTGSDVVDLATAITQEAQAREEADNSINFTINEHTSTLSNMGNVIGAHTTSIANLSNGLTGLGDALDNNYYSKTDIDNMLEDLPVSEGNEGTYQVKGNNRSTTSLSTQEGNYYWLRQISIGQDLCGLWWPDSNTTDPADISFSEMEFVCANGIGFLGYRYRASHSANWIYGDTSVPEYTTIKLGPGTIVQTVPVTLI